MRVLQINSVCGIGSTGRIATDINETLIGQGHESIIAYGRGPSQNCDNTIKIGSDKDVYLHVIKTRFTDRHGFGSRNATVQFTRDIEKLKPDIIHLHNIHGYYLNISVLFEFLEKYGKPVLWTLHDCWSFTGHCSHFDYVGCDKWKVLCENCPQKKEYPMSLFADKSRLNYLEKRELFTRVENLKIITPSKWLEELVTKSYLNKYQVKTINNGVDLDLFSYTPSDFKARHKINDKFIILGVANVWTERKGMDYFMNLSRRLREGESIVLVGVSDAQIKKLPANMIGINRTSSVRELAEIYSSADVFVNPTLEDNFPTTNLESLACGTPVITFHTGGSHESVDDKTGIVVKKGDKEGLYNAIIEVKEKGKFHYHNNAIKRAEDYYNKIDKFKEYIELYKSTIKE